MTIERDGLIERKLFDGDLELRCWLPGSNAGQITIDIGGTYERCSTSISAPQARELAAELISLAAEIDKLDAALTQSPASPSPA